MKVGGDAVLLGAWCPLPSVDQPKVLDIGAGTGILSLLLAQRMDSAQVTAVEIDEAAAIQAGENFSASPYAGRIEILAGEIQQLEAAEKSFDLIICNPPFFSGGVLSDQLERNVARHTVKLSHGDLLRAVRKFLKPGGLFSLILPKIEALRFRELAAGMDLFPRHVLEVRPRADKPVHRILQAFGHRQSEKVEVEEIVQYKHEQNWTDAYHKIVGPFYK